MKMGAALGDCLCDTNPFGGSPLAQNLTTVVTLREDVSATPCVRGRITQVYL